ncbi:MAG: methylated-DNA--[protein]-cysteine S-methyltransferase [Phocaeicola sp.]
MKKSSSNNLRAAHQLPQTESWALYSLSIGKVALRQEDGCITAIQLIEQLPSTVVVQPTPLTDLAAAQLAEYLSGARIEFDFPYRSVGTPFQQKVWMELTQIPYGQTRSYQEIAAAIGMPKACRAVGSANRKNPLLIVVPCHRVIAASGKLSGYAAGVELKEQLLTLERVG